ncbi:hypothetical protein TRIATDRAFT_300746 [Trichoderma atroviride IMI 206040]|uniref:Uncharacterized protein n=1 Tax=Hypocrea atroviridis (strain ATCC 20476 / IMI 206040) TaxID=452589 RepID=G9P1R8_HYPAI|nr:uncharacterized protein TRIATDRAFT_300746 [Trichoderma atroviride IMI 206040]EHK42567.1 hypothetical protein TRIATDRAFT_300746 [Trichoderma atroviride IMI 206040]
MHGDGGLMEGFRCRFAVLSIINNSYKRDSVLYGNRVSRQRCRTAVLLNKSINLHTHIIDDVSTWSV